MKRLNYDSARDLPRVQKRQAAILAAKPPGVCTRGKCSEPRETGKSKCPRHMEMARARQLVFLISRGLSSGIRDRSLLCEKCGDEHRAEKGCLPRAPYPPIDVAWFVWRRPDNESGLMNMEGV